jgi:hypothetical protein
MSAIKSQSLCIQLGRDNTINVFDPSMLPHTDELSQILIIAIDVISSGYQGVRVDELRLSNGRHIQAMDVNLDTPEGRIMKYVGTKIGRGEKPPSSAEVLVMIKNASTQAGGFHG